MRKPSLSFVLRPFLLFICFIYIGSAGLGEAEGTVIKQVANGSQVLIQTDHIRLAQNNVRQRPVTVRPNNRRPTRRPTSGNGGRRVAPNNGLFPKILVPLIKKNNDKPKKRVQSTPQKKKKRTKKKTVRKRRATNNSTAIANKDYRAKEIVVVIALNASKRLERIIARQYNLRLMRGYNLPLIDARVQTYKIPDKRTVENVLRRLSRDKRILSVQPNYRYKLVSGPNSGSSNGQKLQYSHNLMQLPSAHGISLGRNINIAIIDTGVDVKHPELRNSVSSRYNAVNPKRRFEGHSHGTAMAGIIRAKGQLTGVAPMARLLDARAFYIPKGSFGPETATSILLRALKWSYEAQAHIINLSFAGPADPLVSTYLEKLNEKGLILVAAAGNGGKKAKPAYPAAYESVIAISALDEKQAGYSHANRGEYISVSAPGVDLVVLSASKSYQIASGTSLAAAQVSGLIALILERNSRLGHGDILSILTKTAKDLGKPGHDDIYGAGLVDAYSSLNEVNKGENIYYTSSK